MRAWFYTAFFFLPQHQCHAWSLASLTNPEGSHVSVHFLGAAAANVHWRTNRSTPPCMTHTSEKPSLIDCPADCPFLRAEPTRLCEFKCVAENHCTDDDPKASFANPNTFRCEGCQAVACEKCGGSPFQCDICQEGFEMSYWGNCVNPYRGVWYLLYLIVLGVVGVLVYYIVLLAIRTKVNDDALRYGLEFREASKLRASHGQDAGKLYNLGIDLGNAVISGTGVMLHFKWQQLILAWSVCCFLILYILHFFFNTRPSALKHDPGTPKAFVACEHGVKNVDEEFLYMEMCYTIATILIYIFSTLASFAMSVYQRRRAEEINSAQTTMQDFVIMAKGFPVKYGDKKLEKDYEDFFRKEFSKQKVIGVSVCWDMRQSGTKSFVDDEIDKIIHDLDIKREKEKHHLSESGREKAKLAATEKAAEDTQWIDPELKFLDAIFGVEGAAGGKGEAEEVPDPPTKAMLLTMKSTQWVFVVFETEKERDDALSIADEASSL
jgi:hypothetical protein